MTDTVNVQRVTVPVEEAIASLQQAASTKAWHWCMTQDAPDCVDVRVADLRAIMPLLAAAPKTEAGEAISRLRVILDQARNGTPVTDPDDWLADELQFILDAFSQPEAPKVEQEPVAYVSRKGFTTGGLVWTKEGRDADLPDETKLYTHPAPSSELLEALWRIEDMAPATCETTLAHQMAEIARIAIVKHKGPQS